MIWKTEEEFIMHIAEYLNKPDGKYELQSGGKVFAILVKIGNWINIFDLDGKPLVASQLIFLPILD